MHIIEDFDNSSNFEYDSDLDSDLDYDVDDGKVYRKTVPVPYINSTNLIAIMSMINRTLAEIQFYYSNKHHDLGRYRLLRCRQRNDYDMVTFMGETERIDVMIVFETETGRIIKSNEFHDLRSGIPGPLLRYLNEKYSNPGIKEDGIVTIRILIKRILRERRRLVFSSRDRVNPGFSYIIIDD